MIKKVLYLAIRVFGKMMQNYTTLRAQTSAKAAYSLGNIYF